MRLREERPLDAGETYSNTNHGDEVGWALSVLQCKGLPEKETPAEEKKHVACSGVDITD